MGGEYSVIGSYGSNEGEFDKPTCVHFAAGNLYVTDTGNSRVQIFSMEGEFLDSFGKADGLISPTAMSSDGKYLFVLDESSSTIFVYTPKGDLLYKLDQHFSKPTDIYFTRGTLYVADKEGAAIKILRNKLYDKAS